MAVDNLSKKLATTQEKLSNLKMTDERLKFDLQSTQQAQDHAQSLVTKYEGEITSLQAKLTDSEAKAA